LEVHHVVKAFWTVAYLKLPICICFTHFGCLQLLFSPNLTGYEDVLEKVVWGPRILERVRVGILQTLHSVVPVPLPILFIAFITKFVN